MTLLQVCIDEKTRETINIQMFSANKCAACVPPQSPECFGGHEYATGSPVEFVFRDMSLSTSHPVAWQLSDWITQTRGRR